VGWGSCLCLCGGLYICIYVENVLSYMMEGVAMFVSAMVCTQIYVVKCVVMSQICVVKFVVMSQICVVKCVVMCSKVCSNVYVSAMVYSKRTHSIVREHIL
jgi:hypothetical protein